MDPSRVGRGPKQTSILAPSPSRPEDQGKTLALKISSFVRISGPQSYERILIYRSCSLHISRGERHCKKVVIPPAKRHLFALPLRGSGPTRATARRTGGGRGSSQAATPHPIALADAMRRHSSRIAPAGTSRRPNEGQRSHPLLPVRSDEPTAPPTSRRGDHRRGPKMRPKSTEVAHVPRRGSHARTPRAERPPPWAAPIEGSSTSMSHSQEVTSMLCSEGRRLE